MNRSDKIMPTSQFTGSRYMTTPELLLMLALMAPIIILMFPVIDRVQGLDCPTGSFLTGMLHIWPLAIGMIAGAFFGYLISRHVVLHLSSWVRKRLNVEITCSPEWHHKWAVISALSLSAAIALVWIAVRMQFCLTSENIIYRSDPTADMRRQSWSDVTGIAIQCSRGNKGHTNLSYTLVMHDGSRVDIGGVYGELENAYPQIKQGLRGVSFNFDTSGIEKDCPLSSLSPLWLKPE